jgi:GMP synthase-like glutamine amidotransferase
MKIGVLQHAAFEGPGEIGAWAAGRGHSLAIHHLYRGDALPEPDSFDLLLVMGGEMNIYQYRDWPWLKAESAFIRSALEAGKRLVGICLGGQLIADALGARVVQNTEIELGWLPIAWTNEARSTFPELAPTATVLHWHGDTFGLPPGAMRLAANEGCAEQGFLVPGKCLGLQFHMEVDPALTKQFVDGQAAWPKGRFVQTPDEVLNQADKFHLENRRLLHGMLDRFCGI